MELLSQGMDISMANIGKLLSSRLVPICTPISNVVRAYLFHYTFTNLHSLHFGKKVTFENCNSSVWLLEQIQTIKKWKYWMALLWVCFFSFYICASLFFLVYQGLSCSKSRIEWMYHNHFLVEYLSSFQFSCCYAAMKYFYMYILFFN